MRNCMHIDVITTPLDQNNDEKITNDKLIVVIDILRVSSTIITAVEAGAQRIYPTLTVAEAFERKENLIEQGIEPSTILLAGERRGLKVEGFDLGNSPLEYSPDIVKNKILVLSSTNGTKAMSRSLKANCVVVGAFLNGSAAAEFINTKDMDIVFYLSGTRGNFSYEDSAGAGFIIDRLLNLRTDKSEADVSKNDLITDAHSEEALFSGDRIHLSDSARMCRDLYNIHMENLPDLLHNVNHGRYLESEGFGKDLDYCARIDVSKLIPIICKDGYISS
jgi:2-phosphosulfolactate phosphatase